MAGEIESVIGGIISIIFIVFVASAMGQVMQTIGEHDHPQLQSKIDSQSQTIEQLRQENKRLEKANENISRRYQELKNQSITKEDIARMQRELNNTNAEVQILNQKFETVNQNFIDAYNKTVNKYQFWFGFSLVSFTALALDILSGAIFGFNFTKKLSESLRALKEKISSSSKNED